MHTKVEVEVSIHTHAHESESVDLHTHTKVKVKVLICTHSHKSESEVAQSCLTLCDPVDCSPPGSSVHGSLQARILEWVAVPSSRGPPHPGIGPASFMAPALQEDPCTTEPPGKPRTDARGSTETLLMSLKIRGRK